MPNTTNDQWIWELEERIYAMTDELCNKNHIIEIAPYINKEVIEEKEKEKKTTMIFIVHSIPKSLKLMFIGSSNLKRHLLQCKVK